MAKHRQPIPVRQPVKKAAPIRKVLQVSAGAPGSLPNLYHEFTKPGWKVVRLDANPENKPDIVGSLLDLSGVSNASIDGVWIYDLNRLTAQQAKAALSELYRITKQGAVIVIHTVDMQRAGQALYQSQPSTVVMKTKNGTNVTVMDVVFGNPDLANILPQHSYPRQSGYTAKLVANMLADAGFNNIRVQRDGLMLYTSAFKVPVPEGKKPDVKIIEEDLNKMMRQRDELDKAPEQWTGYKQG